MNALIEQAGTFLCNITNNIDPKLPPIVAPGFVFKQPVDECAPSRNLGDLRGFCEQLDKSPFHGRDIIYVHGFSFDMIARVFFDLGKGIQKQIALWPQDRDEFFEKKTHDPNFFVNYREYGNTQYWNNTSQSTSHVGKFLGSRNAKNRFIFIGWSTAQRLEYDTHAMLTEIAEAMINGGPEIKCMAGSNVRSCNDYTSDFRGDRNFCARGCVIISHSTGALVTDVAMALAVDSSFQAKYGNVSFIPDRIRTHVSAAGAINGSQWATTVLILARAAEFTTNEIFPRLGEVCTIANAVLDPEKLLAGTGCQFYDRLADSVLLDLNPFRTITKWAPYINKTPVPVLTVAGHSHESEFPWKVFFQRGYDDGVVSMDSSCGRERPSLLWPTGFQTPLVTTLDPRLYDMGMAMSDSSRAVRTYIEKTFERWLSWPPFNLMPRAAAACTPYKSPHGMIERVRWLKFKPLNYYKNHYSFIQTAENHGAAKRAENKIDGLIGGGSPWQEDVRAIMDPYVYTSGLVHPDVKYLQDEVKMGEFIRFKLFGVQHKIYIWRRTYHRLHGWESKAAMDYVYDYVAPQ